MAQDVPPPGPGPGPDPARPLTQAMADLVAELPGLFTDRVQLLSLELQLASQALARIAALGLAAAIFIGTAWLALWAGVVTALVGAGLAWHWAWLLVVLVNLATAAWAVHRLRALAPLLGLPATLRRLTDLGGTEPAGVPSRENGTMP